MIDPSWIIAGGFALSTGWQFLSARRKDQRADYWKYQANQYLMAIEPLRAKLLGFEADRDYEIEALTRKSNELAGELDNIHAQRVAASKKAAAGASARAAARRAKLAAEAPARAEKTITALRSCPPRPREVVVAGVAETRRGKRVAATT